VTAAGVVLQLVGLLIAVFGVRSSHLTVTGEPVGWWRPLRELATDSCSWFKRHVLRRRATQSIPGITGTGSLSLNAPSVSISVSLGRPPESASPAEWYRYLERRLDDHSSDIRDERENRMAEMRRVDDTVARLDRKLDDQAAQHSSRLEQLSVGFGGEDGRGLRRTIAGLGITALGVLLTLIPVV